MTRDRRAAASSGQGRRPDQARALYALLFLSGAAALAHEVVWVRLMADVFGTTAGATAVVLACFMAGMGGGAVVFGRIADRRADGVRLYAFLELGAGALACLVPLFVRLSGPVYGWVFRSVEGGGGGGGGGGGMWPGAIDTLTFARALMASLVLVPPAFLLGGALPALVRTLADAPEKLGPSIGRLYAANTAGAVAGCFLTGYVLVPALGVLGTVFLAAGISLAVGGAAFAVSRAFRGHDAAWSGRRRCPDDAAEDGRRDDAAGPPVQQGKGKSDIRTVSPESHDIPPLRRWAMPALYGASGLAALGCEVLWTRALVFVLRSTVYAFTSMLTVFLVGLAAGGAIGARLARTVRKPALAFACVETGVAVTVALSLVTLRGLAANWVAVDLALESGWAISTLLHLAIAAAVMLAPTVLLGMAFPLAGRLHSPAAGAGRLPGKTTGELLLANTAGGVLGALAAGFVLAPLAGTAYSILALASLSLFVAAGAICLLTKASHGIKVRAFVGAGLVSIALFVMIPPSVLEGLFAAPNPKAELVFVKEDPAGTVTVHRYARTGHIALSAGGVPVAGTAPPLRSTQVLQALIPTLLHPAPRRILQIGLGSGETAHIALSRAEAAVGADKDDKDDRDEDRDKDSKASCTAVEISPAVVRAARTFFGPLNMGVLDDERFSLVMADGVNYARHSRAEFDLVLTESTYPFLSGSSGLYTLDYFRDVRERLAPGGTVSCWLPLDVPERGLRSLLRTFAEAFPHATLWTTSRHGYKHALLLGSAERIEISYVRLARRFREPEVARLLELVGVASPEELAASLMLDREGIVAFSRGAPLHTRNRPVLEYETALRSARNWRERLARNLDAMAPYRASPLEHVDFSGMGPPELSGERRAAAAFKLELAARNARARAKALAERLKGEGEAFPFLARARAARKDGDPADAIGLYRRALEVAPGWEEVTEELGHFYLELGMYEEARELSHPSKAPVGP